MRKALSIVSALALFLLIATPTKAQATYLRIEPTFQRVYVCEEFTIDIVIEDVDDLWFWGVKVCFNPAVVKCIGVVKGPFLESGGGDPGPFAYHINNIDGFVRPGLTLESCPSASGSSVLATITFHCLGPGVTDLHLSDTELVDTLGTSIPHVTVDGSVAQCFPGDSDGDGLSDCEELAGWDVVYYPCVMEDPPYPSDIPTYGYHVTSDPNVADADGDMLTDAQEREGWDVRVAHPFGRSVMYHVWSDPNVADNDGNGKDDYTEWLHRTDPNKSDTDCDGAYDTNDGFEIDHGLDPLHFDSDRDGIRDGEEIDLWLEAGLSLDEAVANTKGPDAVGGVWTPTNKFELLAPYIGLASLITVATLSVVYVKYRKKKQT